MTRSNAGLLPSGRDLTTTLTLGPSISLSLLLKVCRYQLLMKSLRKWSGRVLRRPTPEAPI